MFLCLVLFLVFGFFSSHCPKVPTFASLASSRLTLPWSHLEATVITQITSIDNDTLEHPRVSGTILLCHSGQLQTLSWGVKSSPNVLFRMAVLWILEEQCKREFQPEVVSEPQESSHWILTWSSRHSLGVPLVRTAFGWGVTRGERKTKMNSWVFSCNVCKGQQARARGTCGFA